MRHPVAGGVWHRGGPTRSRGCERPGAVLVGKSNCPEFALGVDTDNDLFGHPEPVGALDARRVERGRGRGRRRRDVLVGLGSDYGGSIRWPAQCTGLIGLRPTVGRVSRLASSPPAPRCDALAARSFLARGPGRRTSGPHRQDVFTSVPGDLRPRRASTRSRSDEPLRDYRDLRRRGPRGGLGPRQSAASTSTRRSPMPWPRAASDPRDRARDVTEGAARRGERQGPGVYDGFAPRAHEAPCSPARRAPDLIGDAIKAMLRPASARRRRAAPTCGHERDALIDAAGSVAARRAALCCPSAPDGPRDLHGRVADFHLLRPAGPSASSGSPRVRSRRRLRARVHPSPCSRRPRVPRGHRPGRLRTPQPSSSPRGGRRRLGRVPMRVDVHVCQMRSPCDVSGLARLLDEGTVRRRTSSRSSARPRAPASARTPAGRQPTGPSGPPRRTARYAPPATSPTGSASCSRAEAPG